MSDIEEDVWLLIRSIRDPEYPYTLGQLRVVSPFSTDFALQYLFVVLDVRVDDSKSIVYVSLRPTVPHCSMATLIGLCVRTKLERELIGAWRFRIGIVPGSHLNEIEINKQLNDKERISAAIENSHLLKIIENSIIQ